MPFELTKEQRDIQKAAREFAEGELVQEVALEHDLAQKFPRSIWKKACHLGFIGIHFPEEFGGQGCGVLENILVTEQFCRKDSGLGIALSLSDFAAEVVLRFGDDGQKDRFLPSIPKAKALSAGAFTEPEHGCDPESLSTTAIREGSYYILDGKKSFVINGPVADWLVVLCQTDSSAKPKSSGQSLLVVEMGASGLKAVSSGEKMGMHMTYMGDIAFSRTRVPLENRIGPEGGGFDETKRFLEENRLEIAGQAVGIAGGALEKAIAYAKKRYTFGRPIIEHQGLQWMLAEMATEVEAARSFLYDVAYRFDCGEGQVGPQTAMVKIFASNVAMRVSTDAVQVFGGLGYMEDLPLERTMRDAKATQIYPETNQIEKMVISGHLKR
jgi:alkylation response protein AidB-like acyl-CoA dehydrogenase